MMDMAGDYATREWPRHQREAVTKNTAAAVTKNRGRPFTGKAKTVAEHARKHRAAKRGKGAALEQSRYKAVTARARTRAMIREATATEAQGEPWVVTYASRRHGRTGKTCI